MRLIAQWVGAHAGMLAGSFGGAFLLGLASKFLPGMIAKQVALELDAVLDHLKLPEDKAAFHAVVACIDVRFPDAGDAKYAMMVDDLIKNVPSLASSRQALIDLLSGVGAAVKADLDARR